MNDEKAIVVEQNFDAPVEQVWRAITHAEEMRRWYFEGIERFEARPGFETEFTVVSEGRTYPHQWKVTEVVPNRRIAYEWRFRGFGGQSHTDWELSATPRGSKLKVTHVGIETHPQEEVAFRPDSCRAGWEYF